MASQAEVLKEKKAVPRKEEETGEELKDDADEEAKEEEDEKEEEKEEKTEVEEEEEEASAEWMEEVVEVKRLKVTVDQTESTRNKLESELMMKVR